MSGELIIATRKSELALWQANHVAARLRELHPGLNVELLPLVTRGDIILDQPLATIGGKGLFLKELEKALLAGQADIAVHSMKDVPMEPVAGLQTDVLLQRANPADALLNLDGLGLADLPANSVVGTSSLRRRCQLLNARPDLQVRDLRGNVNTRLSKLEQGEYDAIILACAGLERLGLQQHVSQELRPPEWLPAAAQGTIGVQCRNEDERVQQLIAPLMDPDARLSTQAERAVATALQGSCQLPLAVYARRDEKQLTVSALLGEASGTRLLRSDRSGPVSALDGLCAEVVTDLRRQGADDILAALAS